MNSPCYPQTAIASGNSSSPGGPAKAELKPIPSALESQDNLLGGLHGLITDLDQRLFPVLSPDMPSPASDKPPQPPQNVVENIQSHNRSIEAACGRLASLRDRLHV